MLIQIVLFIVGLVGLTIGAEWLVRGSSQIAATLGIRRIVIGLTVVAFGTSSPELVVSLMAAIKHSEGIAIGNVIGSNIANIGLVLGVSAIFSPIAVKSGRQDMVVMIAVSAVFYLMMLNETVGFPEGLILFLGLVAYLVRRLQGAKEMPEASQSEIPVPDLEGPAGPISNVRNVLLVVVGLALLIAGAQLMVRSGVFIARTLGVSELIIGLTLVSVGTSLPELATAVVSALRGENDILMGNIIGSNIFNIMCVIGIVAMVSPLHVDRGLLFFEMPVMLLISLVMAFFMVSKSRVSRAEGWGLFLCYVVFVGLLFWLP